MIRREARDGVVYYISELLERAAVPHAFSTRIGGISEGPFASLNLGNATGVREQDSPENIHSNFDRLQRAIGVEELNRCWVHQVHGREVADVQAGFESGCQADALMTRDPQQLLSIRIADCIPLLFSSFDGAVVAAVHAGWRGVVERIAVHALARMKTPAREILCAIGPCIGFDAFEVGGEVLAAFDPRFCRRRDDGKGYIDLREALRQQLMDAGVREDQIDVSDRCTFRNADEFFSHRRDKGITGRMAAVIAPRWSGK